MMESTGVVRKIALVERKKGILRQGINDMLGAIKEEGKGECATKNE
jgi:hypothetical protein